MLQPLSIAQSELWRAQKLAPGDPAYNLGGYVEILGAVDRAVLESAIRQVLEQADSYHYRFVDTDEGPRQFLSELGSLQLPLVDFSDSTDALTQARVWMRDALELSLDLSSGPLFRISLLKVSASRWFCFGVFHHLVTDFFGAILLLRSVAERYTALLNAAMIPSSKFTRWSEVLEAEREYRASPRFLRDREYWLEQLQHRPEAVTLSGHPPSWRSSAIETLVSIPGSTFRRLEQLGNDCNASVVAVLFAALAVYLSRVTGRQDLLLGMPVSGRIGPKHRGSTGFMANVVPLRLQVRPGGSFTELIRMAAVRVREAFRHQRYGSSLLRADLGLAANAPAVYGPVLNIMPTEADFDFGGSSGRPRLFTNSRIVEDLRISVHAANDGSDVMFHLCANADHYDQPTLQAHARGILRLLESALDGPQRALGLLPLVDAAERRKLLDEWSGAPRCAGDPGFLQLFAAQVRRDPAAIAVVLADRSLTYEDLNARATRLAQRLVRQGVGPERIVGLWADRSVEMLIGMLGILKAGGAYLPLDPEYPIQRLQEMAADAQPLLMLASESSGRQLIPGLPQLSIEAASGIGSDATVEARADRPARDGQAAYVIFTSGSTGTPKGVVVTHAGLAALATSLAARMMITARSRVLQLTSLNFDVSVSEILVALAHGATLVLAPADALSGERLRELLVTKQVTHLSVTPAVLATVPRGSDLALECLIVGGEVCPADLIERWSDGLRMMNAYGPTECTVCATMSAPLQAGQPAPIGTPLAGARVYVLDAGLEPAPIGVEGELYISGVGLARGYLHRPGLTGERFVADPYGEPGARMYRSGDLARWREDGTLEFLGRADRQVKVRGHRIELEEIEAALQAQVSIEQALVAAREDAVAGRCLVAYLVPRTGYTVDAGQLRAALAQRLPQFMIPSLFTSLARLPLTRSGKLDRQALLAATDAIAAPANYELPLTPTEVQLAAIWCELLRRERVGRFDDFFEVGGHSLLALQVIARVRESFRIELPLKTLFDASRLNSMASAIDQSREAGLAQPIAPIAAVQGADPGPLSYSQERMWLIQSLNPQTIAYNLAGAFWIHGAVDVPALSSSLDELIERHEILRSRIQVVGGKPQQIVEPGPSGSLKVLDLRQHPHAEEEAIELATAESRVVIDLLRDPTMRTRLFHTGADRFLFFIVIHHVASDQWSMGIFGRELAALYNARVTGVPAQLPALPRTYRDFSRWQRSAAFNAQFDQHLHFWARRLADLPTVDLPIDHPRPKIWTMSGAVYQRQIPATLFNAINDFARGAGATQFMTLFAGFAVLLHRLSGQTDLPIGVPVANRTHSAMEGMIGTFVNTLVLRADLHGDPQFDQLLERVRASALEAFQNQDVSFDRLVQEVGQRGDRSRAPLVQVMFNVANAPMDGIEFHGLQWQPVMLNRGGAQFELGFSVDTEVTHMLGVDYNTDLFDRATIERMVGQYFIVLAAAIAAPQSPLSRLALLPEDQLQQLRSWNATQMALAETASFPRLFEAQAVKSPDAIAISCAGETWSYAHLNAQSNRFARVLSAAGVAAGANVGICMDRSPLLLVTLLAVQKSAGAYMPLDPELPPERMRYMLEDSGTSVLVTAGPLPPQLNVPPGIRLLDVAAALPQAQGLSAQNLGNGPGPQDRAYLLYTSGSTGKPKGVSVPHRALANFLLSMQQRPGLAASDVVAAVTTIHFDIAALELYLPLTVGARVDLVSREIAIDGEKLAEHLRSCGATLLQATPGTWRMLLETDWRPGAPFRALCGGETLSRTLANGILERVGALWNLYGPTETTIWSSVEQMTQSDTAVSIGRPIGNTQVHILDSAGELVPIGVVGEICIGGAGVADGYPGRAALTAERFVPDRFAADPGMRLYKTGDLGRWGVDGKLYHLGRSDFQVKIRGYRIELGEIEEALNAHPAVQQAVVAVRESRTDDPRLVAFVKYRQGQDATMGDLKRELRVHLPEYMVPSIIVAVDAIPLTPNGKVDRAALPNPFAAALVDATVQEPPATQMEQVLAQIWTSVLNIDQVSVLDNFFELGGYSLLSLRVAIMIKRRTGRQLDPRALFFQNLREIAGTLESQDSPGAAAR